MCYVVGDAGMRFGCIRPCLLAQEDDNNGAETGSDKPDDKTIL